MGARFADLFLFSICKIEFLPVFPTRAHHHTIGFRGDVQNQFGRTESNGLFQIKKSRGELPPSAADSRNEFGLLQAHQYLQKNKFGFFGYL
jgi:hypothetical protein